MDQAGLFDPHQFLQSMVVWEMSLEVVAVDQGMAQFLDHNLVVEMPILRPLKFYI